MGALVLDDRSGRIEVTLFSEVYEQYRELLAGDRVLVVIGNLNHDEYRGGLSIRADQVLEFQRARALHIAVIRLSVAASALQRYALSPSGLVQELEQILTAYPGTHCGLQVLYRRPDVPATLVFDRGWRVDPTDELIRRLERLLGQEEVELVYANRGK